MDAKPLIRSFGRIKCRKLSTTKEKLLSDLLIKYQINEDFLSKKTNYQNLANNFKNIVLEIGSGFGDFVFAKAKAHPDNAFIACETHINGIVNLLAKLEKNPLNNIKIFNSDIRLLLNNIKYPLFDKIYILFPDPWPKVRHYKRRLINEDFLESLNKVILNNGKLIIATDHDSYKSWILAKILKNDSFKWTAVSKNDWQNFPEDWVHTKYQKKAVKEGRSSIFLEFKK